jgi:Concanavalin A-like lectin/glucanases superfamily
MTTRDLVIAAAGGETATPDPYFENVSLLLTGDGTNGAQNNTFLDSSTNNFTITRNGNTTQGSFSPYGNLWSNYFDGTDDGLRPIATPLQFGTGDFTVEAWINPNTVTTQRPIVALNRYDISTGWNFGIGVPSAGYLYWIAGGTTKMSYSGINVGVWNHVAVSRSGTTLRMFLNGTQVATATDSTDYTSASSALIGQDWNSSVAYYYIGYISNLRVIKGTALYTSNFTPSTTPLTAVSGTSLLTCQSNRFRDNSSNNYALTVYGDVSVQRFSPFNPTAPYSTSTIGGSGYFDGTGDYLGCGTNSAYAMGTGDFTWEAWINFPSGSTYRQVFSTRPTGGASSANGSLAVNPSNGLTWYTSGFIVDYRTPIGFNQWIHVAVCRSGTTLRVFANGVQVGSATNSDNLTGSAFTVGANGDGTEPFNGYISSARIVKGTAVYTSNFTPPTAPITAVSGTSLLCNFTNAGIPDAAMMNDLETVGNAQVSTSVKKYGTGSLAFDGTGDYLVAPANPTYNFGTGDFTLECWIYRNTATTSAMLDARGAPAASPWCWYISTTSGTVSFYDGTNYTTSSNVPTGQWVHLAVTRQSGTLKHWINGTLANTPVTVSTALNAGGAMLVGSLYDAGFVLNGYIDDLRITKGYARYTSNFTPPAQALPTQ